MVSSATAGSTTGSKAFDPDKFCEQWSRGDIDAPQDNDLQLAVKNAFGLSDKDDYVYHAVASVKLAQVQYVIEQGRIGGMHAWYLNEEGKPLDSPSQGDIGSYTSIFASTTSTPKAMNSFEKNAKKESIRASIAKNLTEKRLFPSDIVIPKLKTPHVNPYFEYWAWSCKNLEWAGPDINAVNVKHSHHLLPIFYHHFGCVCPSFESLETVRQVGRGSPVIEVGSGNGYWTYMLRRLGLRVTAVDNGDSLWRTMWIGDTVKADATSYLKQHNSGKDSILLMVYPQVSTNFTISALQTYKGDTICVAGTQNANGFTAFKDVTIDQFMAAEKPEYAKIIQTPLPSFAGKDEAFFVFQRR